MRHYGQCCPFWHCLMSGTPSLSYMPLLSCAVRSTHLGKHLASGPEQLSQVVELSFKNCNLGPKAAIFGPKKPRNTFKTAKRRETVGTLHVRLDFPVSMSSLQPSNSTICPGNGPTRPPKAPNADSHKPRIGHIFGYMARNAIPRAPNPPAIPHFLWFPPLRIASTTPRPLGTR